MRIWLGAVHTDKPNVSKTMECLTKPLLILFTVLSPAISWAEATSDIGLQPVTQEVTQQVEEAVISEPKGEELGSEAVVLSPHHDLSPYGMYQAADWVVKSVMILLLVASGVTWAIGIAKQIQLHLACCRAKHLLTELLDSETLVEGKLRCNSAEGAGLALLEATEKELALSARADNDDGIKERLQLRLERVQAGLSSAMTSGTGVLATVGSVGPFIGLFGTVWGIMNAFIGIAKSQNTSLAVVAPGIAEALLATAIGLVAAIPAVVLYNHFIRGVGQYRALMADISAALMVLVSRDLDREPISIDGKKLAA
ncbi:tonB-system energizer ExbB [Vibrio aquaticus]|uniref:tonB-system energizer ExbB n=1 Tax=Vibrio aquaticus TaxID=2496559 RepID=UPI001FC917D5|nr:tonB-system energizer ExbB [Vibrio aquaticus]